MNKKEKVIISLGSQRSEIAKILSPLKGGVPAKSILVDTDNHDGSLVLIFELI